MLYNLESKHIPMHPLRGMKFKVDICEMCGVGDAIMKISNIRNMGMNEDGSTCYTFKYTCDDCGQETIISSWWNHYEKGEIVL